MAGNKKERSNDSNIYNRKKGRRKSHPVWFHFEDYRVVDGSDHVKCLYCQLIFSERNPQNLAAHIKKQHPGVISKVLETEMNDFACVRGQCSSKPTSTQFPTDKMASPADNEKSKVHETSTLSQQSQRHENLMEELANLVQAQGSVSMSQKDIASLMQEVLRQAGPNEASTLVSLASQLGLGTSQSPSTVPMSVATTSSQVSIKTEPTASTSAFSDSEPSTPEVPIRPAVTAAPFVGVSLGDNVHILSQDSLHSLLSSSLATQNTIGAEPIYIAASEAQPSTSDSPCLNLPENLFNALQDGPRKTAIDFSSSEVIRGFVDVKSRMDLELAFYSRSVAEFLLSKQGHPRCISFVDDITAIIVQTKEGDAILQEEKWVKADLGMFWLTVKGKCWEVFFEK